MLHLAKGARVMLTINGPGYYNGSLGTIWEFGRTVLNWDGKYLPAIQILLDTEIFVDVPVAVKEVIGFKADSKGNMVKEVLASVTQFPIALGYAWTIHKSQGQTLKEACIDLGRGAFTHGQTYVALSRLESMNGLYLVHPLSVGDLLLDPDVPRFLYEYSQAAPHAGVSDAREQDLVIEAVEESAGDPYRLLETLKRLGWVLPFVETTSTSAADDNPFKGMTS